MTTTKNESLPERASPADALRGLAAVIRKHGTCPPAALEHVAQQIDALTREAPTEGVDGDVMEMRICETRRLPLRPNRRYVFTIDPNCEACRAWNSYYPEDATPPAPQRHPDALEDGSLSKSTVKRVDALRMAQGDLQVFQCPQCPTSVEYAGKSRPPCPRCDATMELDATAKPTQPPHQDRGEVAQRARELLAAEYRTHGWHEDAGRLCMGGDTTTFVEDDALRVVGRLLEEGDEDSHVITELGRLLAQIAITLKGPEPAGTAWSYHDLPAMVAALTEAKQQGPGEAVAWSVLQIGNQGAAYDPPNAKRAFTYDKQPGNVDASKLGRAADVARNLSAGDSIDRGLALLKTLQDEGFGVFQIGAHVELIRDELGEAKPVGSLNVRRWRGIDAMTNHDFDYFGDLPDGSYLVYTAPQVEAKRQAGEGFVLVPRDLRTACDVWEAGIRARNNNGTVAGIWDAMIAAAAKPSGEVSDA